MVKLLKKMFCGCMVQVRQILPTVQGHAVRLIGHFELFKGGNGCLSVYVGASAVTAWRPVLGGHSF